MDFILNFEFNSLLGLLLFWVPLSLCVFGYTLRTASDYMTDKAERDGEDSTWYTPSLTIGIIVGRALVSIIPIANIWAALFDIAPKLFSKFFSFLGSTFDIALVPDTAAAKARRKLKEETKRANASR